MKNFALLALLLSASSVFGSNAESEVLIQVLTQVGRSIDSQNARPAVIANETSGGAEGFAAEWMLKHRGKVIAREVADAYKNLNTEPHPLAPVVSKRLPRVDLTGYKTGEYDWNKIDTAHPGVKSVVVLSRPAFDRLETVALVRADIVHRDGKSRTIFYDMERQPNGAWEIQLMSDGSYAATRRPDAHLHLPADNAYYHEP